MLKHASLKVAAFITLTAALLTGSLSAQPATMAHADKTTYKQQIFADTNKYRQQSGVGVLYASPHLDRIAQKWADHLARTGEWRHNPNLKNDVWSTPGWTYAGENIAAQRDDGSGAVRAWIDSPGHRKNLVGGYNRIGIGVAFGGPYGKYYVQVFGNNPSDPSSGLYGPPYIPTSPPTSPPVTPPPVVTPPPTQQPSPPPVSPPTNNWTPPPGVNSPQDAPAAQEDDTAEQRAAAEATRKAAEAAQKAAEEERKRVAAAEAERKLKAAQKKERDELAAAQKLFTEHLEAEREAEAVAEAERRRVEAENSAYAHTPPSVPLTPQTRFNVYATAMKSDPAALTTAGLTLGAPLVILLGAGTIWATARRKALTSIPTKTMNAIHPPTMADLLACGTPPVAPQTSPSMSSTVTPILYSTALAYPHLNSFTVHPPSMRSALSWRRTSTPPTFTEVLHRAQDSGLLEEHERSGLVRLPREVPNEAFITQS